jgi:hypothetical protein
VSFSLLFFGFTSFDIYYLFVIEIIIIRTIAMKEIFMRHNGLNLKSILLEVLADHGIKIIRQLYSVTNDNGSNMLNAVKRLIDEAIEGKSEEGPQNGNDSGMIFPLFSIHIG